MKQRFEDSFDEAEKYSVSLGGNYISAGKAIIEKLGYYTGNQNATLKANTITANWTINNLTPRAFSLGINAVVLAFDLSKISEEKVKSSITDTKNLMSNNLDITLALSDNADKKTIDNITSFAANNFYRTFTLSIPINNNTAQTATSATTSSSSSSRTTDTHTQLPAPTPRPAVPTTIVVDSSTSSFLSTHLNALQPIVKTATPASNPTTVTTPTVATPQNNANRSSSPTTFGGVVSSILTAIKDKLAPPTILETETMENFYNKLL